MQKAQKIEPGDWDPPFDAEYFMGKLRHLHEQWVLRHLHEQWVPRVFQGLLPGEEYEALKQRMREAFVKKARSVLSDSGRLVSALPI